MHDGSFATLEAVVEYYDRGGNANPGLDTHIRLLRLSIEEKLRSKIWSRFSDRSQGESRKDARTLGH